MYQVKIVDTNGRTSVQPLGKREERREFPEIFELAAKMDVMAKLAR